MEGFDVRTCSGSHVGKCVDVWEKLLFGHAMSVDDARWGEVEVESGVALRQ